MPSLQRKNQRFILIILIQILLIYCFVCICTATETDLYVDASNTEGPWDGTQENPFRFIQDAVDAAQTDSTIFVATGTYQETIVIQKDLTLIGEHKDFTFVDGGHNGHVIHVQGSVSQYLSVNISGFTIKNAGGLGYDCLALSYLNSGTFKNLILRNSEQSEGIQLDHCNELIINNNFIKNNIGAGISLTLSSNNIIKNNVIQENQKGISISYSSHNNIINNNVISDNSQYGIYIHSSENNRLYLNDIKNNGQNAQDIATNQWSYNNQGNYWDDYSDYDENPKDGIGDSAYSIPGGSNEDIYPLGYFLEQDSPPGGGNQAPTAYKPTVLPSTVNLGEEITFSGGGIDNDGYIVAYSWRSNLDGHLNDQDTFSSSELSVGPHTIYFKVRDNDGEWSTEKTTIVNINDIDNVLPIATIIYVKPASIKHGELLYFNGEGIDQDGSIVGYKWESNIDQIIDTKKSFSANTLSPGTHTISFSVQDDTGQWSSRAKTTVTIEYVADPSEIIPHIENSKYPTSYRIKFNASNTIGGDDFFWDFGDGSFGTGVSPTHTYGSPGNYTITLTVRNTEGNVASSETFVNISENIQSDIPPQNLDQTPIELPLPIMILIQIIIVIGCIIFFFMWMKHR